MANIVLASGAPRRQELLERIGIADFTVRVPEADESYDPAMTPQEIVCHISRKKSAALESAAFCCALITATNKTGKNH